MLARTAVESQKGQTEHVSVMYAIVLSNTTDVYWQVFLKSDETVVDLLSTLSSFPTFCLEC